MCGDCERLGDPLGPRSVSNDAIAARRRSHRVRLPPRSPRRGGGGSRAPSWRRPRRHRGRERWWACQTGGSSSRLEDPSDADQHGRDVTTEPEPSGRNASRHLLRHSSKARCAPRGSERPLVSGRCLRVPAGAAGHCSDAGAQFDRRRTPSCTTLPTVDQAPGEKGRRCSEGGGRCFLASRHPQSRAGRRDGTRSLRCRTASRRHSQQRACSRNAERPLASPQPG